MNNLPGAEPSFAALMGGRMDSRVVASFTARPRRSALDIGTEDGSALWYLHHQMPSMTELHGVDKTALQIVLRNKSKGEVARTTLFELYQDWVTSMGKQPTGVLKTADEFDKLFKFTFDWDICFQNIDRTYDFVIAGHLLHYLAGDELDAALKKIRCAMGEEALVYASIKEKPASGYGWDNSWNHCKKAMEVAALEWGIAAHLLPVRDNGEGRSFVITNIY